MTSVNLLPPDVLHARRCRRKLRRWTAMVSAVSAVAAIPLSFDVVQTARAVAAERESAPLQQRLQTVRDELKSTVARQELLATQVAQADALRAKRAWSGLLATVAERLPEQVWLLSVETVESKAIRAEHAVKSSRAAAGGGGTDGITLLDGPTGLKLNGYALDHEWLYEFMSRLKTADLFTRVELVKAGREPVLDGEAVRFELECEWWREP